MTKLRKMTVLTFLLVACAGFLWIAFGEAHGQFTFTVNGQQVEGAPKLVLGSLAFVVAGIATLVALGIAALAVAGSGFLVFCTLGLTALILLAVALPFLLPLLVPIALVAFAVMMFRRSTRANRG